MLDGRYKIDVANSRIGFAARYAMVTTVRGTFDRFRAEIDLDAKAPAHSSVSVRVETASLNTGQAQRDEHLRSPDFLDVATYPEITFEAARVEPRDERRYLVDGELCICGSARPFDVEMDVSGESVDHRGYKLVGLQGAAQINRSDFGLRWNTILETGGVLVSDEVELSFDVVLISLQGAKTGRPRRRRSPFSLLR